MGAIALMTAGDIEDETLHAVDRSIESTFAMRTTRERPLADVSFAYDAARMQYSSTLILREALQRPSGAVKMLVLTGHDIFIPMLTFVYGQAQLNGAAAIVSTARLRQQFYGLPADRDLFLLRVRKEVQHEIGHTFGLTHCEDPLCTMRISTNLQQLDGKNAAFCAACQVLLAEALGSAAVVNGRSM